MLGEEARVLSEVVIGILQLEQTPSTYCFRRYKQLSLAYDAAREATASAQHRAIDYYDAAAAHHKLFQVGDRVRIRIPTLSQSSSKLSSKWSEIRTISKLQSVVATLTDPTTQSQTTVHVDRLSACSHRLRDELDVHDYVPLSPSVSGASLQDSVHDDPLRPVASVELRCSRWP